MKKTKMVCTIGPSTSEYEMICKLLKAGMNVARLNMSHGDLDSHQHTLDLVKKARVDLGLPCAIMVDTCGPELRIGTFKNHKISLKKGSLFVLSTDWTEGDETKVHCPYPALLSSLKLGQKVYANNGLIEFSVREISGSDIICKVMVGGELSDHKSISIPRVRFPLPFISEKDKNNIEFAAKNDVEYISASFVNRPQDVEEMRNCISSFGGRQEIISKIESAEGILNMDKIIALSDGIMVARGDMGTEIPVEQIPAVQKKMIEHTINCGKKVIVATEMLESMTYQRRPTRAETTDVSQAIYDKTGATMLSGETASGKYPIESATMMTKIALATERVVDYNDDSSKKIKCLGDNLSAIAYSACEAAKVIGAKAIVCFTDKGKTAEHISQFRPKANIIAITHDSFTFNKMSLTWGTQPVLVEEKNSLEEMLSVANEVVKYLKVAKEGDKIVLTLGVPIKDKGMTNAIKISEVE